ncbi:hypothetical protein PAPYR_7362 [Paratrimastix pyriformis]|uniref:WWE domain-containing protein n=1 Tax=Paratrimastix pyriformis TaxID=342808 RepID=A0ABQ8UD72_9EUKA|nr:hypothetical protein PAPYR_7362 [Paratrimastix pyriformis]
MEIGNFAELLQRYPSVQIDAQDAFIITFPDHSSAFVEWQRICSPFCVINPGNQSQLVIRNVVQVVFQRIFARFGPMNVQPGQNGSYTVVFQNADDASRACTDPIISQCCSCGLESADPKTLAVMPLNVDGLLAVLRHPPGSAGRFHGTPAGHQVCSTSPWVIHTAHFVLPSLLPGWRPPCLGCCSRVRFRFVISPPSSPLALSPAGPGILGAAPSPPADFQWEWKDDADGFTSDSVSVSRFIEDGYLRWLHDRRGAPHPIALSLTSDPNLAPYVIDFRAMHQYNHTTGRAREIRRTPPLVGTPPALHPPKIALPTGATSSPPYQQPHVQSPPPAPAAGGGWGVSDTLPQYHPLYVARTPVASPPPPQSPSLYHTLCRRVHAHAHAYVDARYQPRDPDGTAWDHDVGSR